ncbi:hypothetical protein [Gloeobacter morelensis]|uniref:Uncharacterized protein n=1 Tax=Gloeobacter morelensis MG652769 TaxID=2781736 RepID=A0ABY3PJ08_9CYAN|nr:hypothetical protein [Gloeobacter morelensis]UFP93645.1 hypothetical protein ISF26_17920 [Gloeobacter morelensis MG652769]
MLSPTRHGALRTGFCPTPRGWTQAGTIAGKFALLLQAAEIGDRQRELGVDLPNFRRSGWYGLPVPADG